MLFAKSHSFAVLALATASLMSGAVCGYAAPDAGIVVAQDQTDPAAEAPAATNDAPAAADETTPQPAPEAGSSDTSETPAETTETPAQPADADSAAKPDDGNGAAGDTQAAPETPAATSDTQASGIDASQLKIGTAVFGSDGQKIGEVNGVKSDTSGKVQEILVTDGVAAGLNAKVFAVPGDKIADVADGVKLSLSSEEAKQLPVIDNGNG